jgi:hypothetical protein
MGSEAITIKATSSGFIVTCSRPVARRSGARREIARETLGEAIDVAESIVARCHARRWPDAWVRIDIPGEITI